MKSCRKCRQQRFEPTAERFKADVETEKTSAADAAWEISLFSFHPFSISPLFCPPSDLCFLLRCCFVCLLTPLPSKNCCVKAKCTHI